MILLPLLFGLRALGVVDRVEGSMAVVEWRLDTFSDVPLALLPAGLREGDQVIVALSLGQGGLALATDSSTLLVPRHSTSTPLSLVLPPGLRVQPGVRYQVRLSASRRFSGAPRASRPRVGRKGRLSTNRPQQEVIPL